MEKTENKKRFLVELLVFCSYVLYSFSMETGNLFMKDVMAQFNIQSMATGSHLSNANSLGKLIGTVFSGFVLYRLGYRYAFFIAGLLVAIGTFFVAFSPDFQILLFFRFLMGLGGALMLSLMAGIVFQWFSTKEKSIVNSVNGIAYSFGATLAISFAWSLAAFLSWREVIVLIGISSLLASLLWIFLIKKDELSDGSEKEGGKFSFREIASEYRKILTKTQVFLFGLGQAGVLGFYLCFLTFFPRYYAYELQSHAGTLVSHVPKIIAWVGLVSALLGGVLAKYYTNRLMVLRLCSFLQIPAIVVLTLSKNEYFIVFSAFCVGVSIFLAIGSYISYAQEWKGMDAKSLGIVFGLFWFIAYVFATPAPWIFGFLIDKTGSYTASFIFVILLDSLYFISSMLLNRDGLRKSFV